MSINKLNTFLSTLNFVLCFIGYQLVTSLFLPVSSDIEGISRTVTVPYRAFALLISLLVIFINLKKKIGKTPIAIKVLWIYWIVLIIRIFYDTNIRTEVKLRDTTQLWLYVFGIVIPAMFSVMKSYRNINLNKTLMWVYFGTVLTLVLSLFNNASLLNVSEVTERTAGNLALNTISFGHLGTTGIILSLFILSIGKLNNMKKIVVIVVILLSFFIMLRAGSRSPILAFVIVLLFWLFSRGKNVVLGFSISAIAVALLIVFIDPILNFMGNISPVIESRIRLSLFEGNTGGRDLYYEAALQTFLDNPIFGSQFALFDNFGDFHYSHNIFLDSLMGLGLIGGIAIFYILWISVKNSYVLSKNYDSAHWISLILIQHIVLSMLSGAIYYNQILNVLIVFVIFYSKQKDKTKRKWLYNV